MIARRIPWVLAASLSVVTPVLAQPAPSAQASGKALAVGHEALDLYNKGSWAEARAKFAEADGLAHSPVFVLYLARCARNAGDLAGSKEAYERVAAESLPAGSPAPWVGAVESAKKELEELKKKMAELAAAAPTTAPSGTAAPTGTGTASPTGTLTAAPTATVTAPPTGTFRTGPLATGTAAPTGTWMGGPGPGGTAQPGSLAPGLAVVAVGVAAIGVGTGLFVSAKSVADDVLSRCTGDACRADDVPKKDQAIELAQVATGAFIGGGVALGAGVVLLLLRPGGKPAPPQKGSVRIEPGIGSLRVSGSF